jgi:5-oxoprolinase (ATP-hydrolysing)
VWAEIKVWADVGGTFTDCFVITGGRTLATKVLSSGVMRATVAEPVADCKLRLRDAGSLGCDQFWQGATVSLLRPDGNNGPGDAKTARVRGFNAAESLLEIVSDDEAWSAVSADTVIELDAGLEAPVVATRLLLGIPVRDPLPPLDVRLGTTRGTNALLTRRGAPVGLLVTAGFGDVLRIGQQNRPDLFSLAIDKPPPLTEDVVEVNERLDARGNVLTPIDLEGLREQLLQLRRRGVKSLSICLLHAYVSDVHERRAEKLARELGFDELSLSSEVAPLIKLVSRAETTTLDAYLNPILTRYVANTWSQFGGRPTCRLRLMTSAGNLVAPPAFRGRDSILSGPAGGAVALAAVSEQAGADAAIGLDMGGTSTDVSRFEGRVGRRYESEVAGVQIMTPMMDIHTVAAGGGSICSYRHGRFHVGPDSAGADPGPACYGRGGPLTITDVNLLLGRIPAARFPLPLDRDAAMSRLIEIVDRARDEGHTVESAETIADGFLNIAVTHMAEAARQVSTAEGTDPRVMTLVGFGGAAGQHLCRVADGLQMRRILDHPHAGMLSALGMGLASVGHVITRGVYRTLDAPCLKLIEKIAQQLKRDTAEQLTREQPDSRVPPQFDLECDLRYEGADSPLSLALSPATTLAERFHQKHRATFGYDQTDRAIELVCVRCDATVAASYQLVPPTPSVATDTRSTIRLWCNSRWTEVDVIDRASLSTGQAIEGPSMIVSDHSTLLVEPNWQGQVRADAVIELQPLRQGNPSDAVALVRASEPEQDPVLLEVVSRRLQGIADAMGEVLRRTSVSVNVKERRDYSCAVFRGDGSLIANAPHVPVHLGAMGHTVRHLMKTYPKMSAGDCYLSNDPFAGGSHLPDVTAVTPVFCEDRASGRPDFFVASRAHHAEIGGKTPGSMPPDATSLAEEGVLIRDFALVRGGVGYHDPLRSLLCSGRYPSRNADENLADIAAQQAAGNDGVRALVRLAAVYSTETIDALMGRLLQVAGDSIAEWIETLSPRPMTFRDSLDDGTTIAVTITRQGRDLVVDFSGTAGVHPNGFNATESIVTAAVLYVLRCVSGADLPLCDGVLRDVDLRIPAGLLNPPHQDDPEKCAAVVAGNVETSQRVVDVLLGALHLAAASQGTMNNLLIGDDTFGYYETIGGGSGAVPGHPGADAVHTHMTNTRITDPEVLESRLPIRLHRFAIRSGSGGAGEYPGGAGIVRELEFLKPLQVSLITSRRTIQPYGMEGGQGGAAGENLLVRSSQQIKLPPAVTLTVNPGDRLILKTPGGGGWGSPETGDPD